MLKNLFGNSKADDVTALDYFEGVVYEADTAKLEQQLLLRLCQQLGKKVAAYLVESEGDHYQIVAVHHYPESLKDLRLSHGPWLEREAKSLKEKPTQLYAGNSEAVLQDLSKLGVLQSEACMVLPLNPKDPLQPEQLRAVVLHTTSKSFSLAELQEAERWLSVTTELAHIKNQAQSAQRNLVHVTRAFIEAAESQDFSQLGHAQRVTRYAMELGRSMNLNKQELFSLYMAAMLHDVGKLGLTDWSAEDDSHAQRGANMLSSSDLLADALPAIRAHHERWDGQGFPDGLQANAIPLLARIVAVADVYDFLSSERGQALPMFEVEKELQKRAAKELDPELVSLFLDILRKGKKTQQLPLISTVTMH